MWQQIFLIFVGLSSGIIIAGGVVGLMIGLSIVPRYAGITHTADHMLLYEDMTFLGIVLGNLFCLFQPSLPLGNHFSYLIWYLFRYFSGKLDSGSCRSCRCLSRFLSENSSHPRASRHYYCHCRRKICRMLPFLLSQMAISFLIICIKHIKVKRNPVFSQIFSYLPKNLSGKE